MVSSPGPQRYPTAPCPALPAPWPFSDNPPSTRWGRRVGSTSNLSAGSGENNGAGCDNSVCGGDSASEEALFVMS